MKHFYFIPAIFMLLSLSALSQSADEEKIASRVEQLRKLMVDPDKKVLEELVMPLLSYGHSSGAIDDKDIFIEKLVSGKSDFVSLEFSGQTISVSGKVALVRHTLAGTTNDNNTPGKVNLKVLLVWQKDKGDWKLLARQAVRL
jgi:Domain of unknown function (DUF4440)